jgi:hypothetical protein
MEATAGARHGGTYMPRGRKTRPILVAVHEIPKVTRRGVYVELVEEFANSDVKIAKIEGAKTSAYVSVKKAVTNLGLKNVTVSTANGEVYLSKK